MTEPHAPEDNSGVMIYTQAQAERDDALDARVTASAPPEDGHLPYAAGDPLSPYPGVDLHPCELAFPLAVTE